MKYLKTIVWENKENTLNESKKYSSRTEFCKKSLGAYTAAKNNGWLDEMTWLNRKNVYKDPVDVVYKYYFLNENAMYIGRTIYPELRDRQHRTREKDTVYEFSKENNVEIPKMEILEDGLTVLQGAERERYWAEYYKNKGFTLINKQPCGSLGLMCKGKWSKRKCFEEARKYKSKSEFRKGASYACELSVKNGWINEMHWLHCTKQLPNGYWKNKENFLKEAKKYNSKKELEKGNLAAYAAGRKYGYLDEVEWKNERKVLPYGYWTNKEHVMEEASKYTSRNKFRKGNQSAYFAAHKYGYIEDIDWFDKKRKCVKRGYWKNEEVVIEEAKKYTSKVDFMKNNRNAYLAAIRYGYIKKMDWFAEKIVKHNGYWNEKEHVIDEAKKYTSRSEFSKGSNGAYSSAKKHGWLDEMEWLKSKNVKGSEHVRRKWKTKEDVFKESMKYDSRSLFREKSMQAYEIANKNGWLDEMTWLPKRNTANRCKWTKEKCFEEAKKYSSKSDFFKFSNSAYQRSLKMGYIKEMTWLKTLKCRKPNKEVDKCVSNTKHPKGYWKVKENMMEEAKKYSTKEEFKKGNLTAFLAAYRYGYIDKMDWLVKQKQHKKNYWTYENIEKEAVKYNTKTEFFQKNQTAYRAALKLGIIDDFFMNNYIEY